MQTTESKHEVVSDLSDGRLQGASLAQAMQLLGSDEGAVRTWTAYHLIGDVLRTPDLAQGHDAAFLKRLRIRLQDERIAAPVSAQPAAPIAAASAGATAANEAVFTWARVGTALSVLAVAGAGWLWLEGRSPGSQAPTLALAPVPAANTSLVGVTVTPAHQPGVMLRDPRLDQLIQAHRQAAGGSALQVPAGFLRNATYEVHVGETGTR